MKPLSCFLLLRLRRFEAALPKYSHDAAPASFRLFFQVQLRNNATSIMEDACPATRHSNMPDELIYVISQGSQLAAEALELCFGKVLHSVSQSPARTEKRWICSSKISRRSCHRRSKLKTGGRGSNEPRWRPLRGLLVQASQLQANNGRLELCKSSGLASSSSLVLGRS